MSARDVPEPVKTIGDPGVWERLSAEDFAGSTWNDVATVLVSYAVPVLRGMVRSGAIFAACRAVGRPLPATSLPGDVDQEDLVTETAVLALRDFQKRALEGRGWAPEGGASMTTYFVSGCVLALPGVYRSWRRAHDRCPVPIPPDDVIESVTDPWSDVMSGIALDQELERLDRRTRAVVELRMDGYSYSEIAAHLRTSPRAVEGLLYRARRTLQDRLV